MHLVLDGRPPRARRRSSTRPAPAVSVLRWRSGPGTGGVHPLFSVNEAGRLGASALQSPDSPDGDNVLLVGSSRRAEPGPPGIVLSLVNTSPTEAVTLSVKLAGPTPTSVTGTILSAPPMAPGERGANRGSNGARLGAFCGSVLKGKVVQVTVPATSVVVLTVQ